MATLYPRIARISTPLGVALAIRSDGVRVVESRFVRTEDQRQARIADPVLREAARQVRAYFAKRLRRFDVPLALHGTPFQCAVWEFVTALHTGEIISYGDLARAIDAPRAARGVAAAMACSPLDLFIPAHRVVGGDGTVRGAGRNSIRRRLLAFEGITLR